MATIKPELKTILDRYGIDPRDTSKLWDCRGTIVLYHKAYEVIAAKESITFDPPQMIRAERDEAVVLVVGHMAARSEWSFGEAAPANSKNTYPYAMAEKRAKDRVIAKLVGLAQYVYSEDEADEFKTGERKPVEDHGGTQRKDPPPSSGSASKTDGAPTPHIPVPLAGTEPDWKQWAQVLVPDAIKAAIDAAAVDAIVKANGPALDNLKSVSPKAHDSLMRMARTYIEVLMQRAA